jgi:hypothetical protein
MPDAHTFERAAFEARLAKLAEKNAALWTV